MIQAEFPFKLYDEWLQVHLCGHDSINELRGLSIMMVLIHSCTSLMKSSDLAERIACGSTTKIILSLFISKLGLIANQRQINGSGQGLTVKETIAKRQGIHVEGSAAINKMKA